MEAMGTYLQLTSIPVLIYSQILTEQCSQACFFKGTNNSLMEGSITKDYSIAIYFQDYLLESLCFDIMVFLSKRTMRGQGMGLNFFYECFFSQFLSSLSTFLSISLYFQLKGFSDFIGLFIESDSSMQNVYSLWGSLLFAMAQCLWWVFLLGETCIDSAFLKMNSEVLWVLERGCWDYMRLQDALVYLRWSFLYQFQRGCMLCRVLKRLDSQGRWLRWGLGCQWRRRWEGRLRGVQMMWLWCTSTGLCITYSVCVEMSINYFFTPTSRLVCVCLCSFRERLKCVLIPLLSLSLGREGMG